MKRDHGGGLDGAMAEFGGARRDWIDLSTGINPRPYRVPRLSPSVWTALPDVAAFNALAEAARTFWEVPDTLDIVPAPGASAIIAALPEVLEGRRYAVQAPTYNEYAAAFDAAGWQQATTDIDAAVIVHPNNPDGALWDGKSGLDARGLVIDESFCDVCPHHTQAALAGRDGVIVLKSFGKFWGLAGLRLGFAICLPDLGRVLRARLGPWQVSGPAIEVATAALSDPKWAEDTRAFLDTAADELDRLLMRHGGKIVGGTPLFRLAEFASARSVFDRLARKRILTRIFPYSDTWVRFGIPADALECARLEAALAGRP